MARRLGEAYVSIEADASLFRASAIAGMKKALTGLQANVNIGANTNKADFALRRLLVEIGKSDASVTVDANTKPAQAAMLALGARMGKLAQGFDNLRIGLDDAALLAGVARAQVALRSLAQTAKGVKITPEGITQLEANVLGLEATFASLQKRILQLKPLVGEDSDAMIGAANTTEKLAAATGGLNNALINGGGAWGRYGLGILGARIAMFGGLTTIGGFHLALDLVFETLAAVVPALAVMAGGLGAFALAAVLAQDTLGRISDHLKIVNTVATATGQTIPPLTSAFDKMAGVIRPQVFSLYGAAIQSANSALGGFFQTMAENTGRVLDRFAARMVVDMQSSGTGVKTFVAAGTRDLVIFGEIFQNLGKIIVEVARIANQTHVAEFLLEGIRAASDFLTLILKLPGPLLVTVAALHAFYLYGGLATTAIVALTRPLAALAGFAGGIDKSKTAVAGLTKESSSLERLKAPIADIATGFAAMPRNILGVVKSLGPLLASPWTWAVIGTAAIVALGIAFLHSKDSTDEFIASMNKLVSQAGNFNFINTTAAALIQTNEKLAGAQAGVSQKLVDSGSVAAVAAGHYRNLSAAQIEAISAVLKLQQEQGNLLDQLKLETGRVSQVAGLYGTDLTGAMALAALAGVKVSDFQDKLNKNWITSLALISNLVTGYANMGQGTKQLGADMDVLAVTTSDQFKALQNLNSGFDTFIKTVSGPVTTFIDFANTLVRFGNDASVAGAQITGLGSGVTAMSRKVTDPSLQLQSDFQNIVTSANSLFDAMRLTSAPADQQVKAIKLVIQTMIPLAGANQGAAAEIRALAQEAGGPATGSLQDLARWAGKSKDPLSQLQDIAGKTADQFANLSLDAQKLATTLQQDLTKDEAMAVENAVGLQGAMNDFAASVRNGTTATAAGHDARKALTADLAAVGITGPAADSVLASITGQLGKQGQAADITNKKLDAFTTQIKGTGLQTDKFVQGPGQDVIKMFLQLTNDNVPKAKTAFEQWAHDALDLSTASADKLWDSMRHQLLVDAATKAGATKRSFEDMAAQIGVGKQEADKLWDSLNRLPRNVPVSVPVTLSGGGQVIVQPDQATAAIVGTFGVRFVSAKGAFIDTGSGPTADDNLARVSKGELIVPAWRVAAGQVDHLRGKIPGFAGGGVAGGVSALGAYAHDDLSRISQHSLQMIVDHDKSLIKTAQAAAAAKAAAASGPVNASPARTGSIAIEQAYAASLFPSFGWNVATEMPALIALWNQESGWNPYAVNPSSGAAGIPQALGHGNVFALGDYQAQIQWGLQYIAGRYGDPVGAWGHELAFNWYSQGGLVPGFAAGGVVTDRKAAAFLQAWTTRHGGGAGAAWGPIPVNTQIDEENAALRRVTTLSHASGLSSRQKSGFAHAVTVDQSILSHLNNELGIMRQWRLDLSAQRDAADSYVSAAGSSPALAGNVRAWKSQAAWDQSTMNRVSFMLGNSAATIAAAIAAGKLGPGGLPLPAITHTYGGDVADNIGAFLHSVQAPFGAAQGMRVKSFDRGGFLDTGWTMAHNGTGHREAVGGHATVTLEVAPGGGGDFERMFMQMIKKYVKVKHGGNVSRAFGTPGTVSGGNNWKTG